MSEANLRQIRVLHIVSAGGVASSLQPWLFMPLLTRLPRQRVKSQVACLSPGAVPSAVLRQNGVPTFDLALSRKRFSPTAFKELVQAARHFRPDVIQAWGHTAQIVSALVRKRCNWKPRLVWSISDTASQVKNAGLIDRQKLKYAAKFATRADRIVYTSESAASHHRRVGFPDGGHETIPPGVDAARFKPDFAARRKLREELTLPGETFVIGMVAPFQPEFDHATLIKALGELVKTHPDIAVVLAGHGVQKGNAPLIALIGSGALSTRVHLLGEWSDISALYNACDVVCSSALNDQSRTNLAMAMLCGVPCVATGIGAQGELIGQHGIAIEPGNPAAFVKAITRVVEMTPEKRTHMAQGARKHALSHYVYVRSLQKYLQLYYDLIGRQSLVTKDLPAPEVDATLTVPPALPSGAEMTANQRKPITVVDLSDPDSLEAKVAEREPDELPKWRIEQEQERKKREAELAAQVAASKSVGDVLQEFEIQQQSAPVSETPMTERARGVADESEELLSAEELLAAEAPAAVRAPSVTKQPSPTAPADAVSQQEAAKQAALKAARMAALQPIAPPPRPVVAPKAASATTKPPVTRPISSPATRSPGSQPATRPPISQPATRPVSQPATRPAALTVEPVAADSKPQHMSPALEELPSIDLDSTQPLGALAQELANAALPPTELEPPKSDAPPAPDLSKTAASDALDIPLLPSFELAADVISPELAPSAATPAESHTTPPMAESAAVSESSSIDPSPSNLTEYGELALLATGEWLALQRSDVTTETKPAASDAKSETRPEPKPATPPDAKSETRLETKPEAFEGTPETRAEAKPEASEVNPESPAEAKSAASEAKAEMQAAAEPAKPEMPAAAKPEASAAKLDASAAKPEAKTATELAAKAESKPAFETETKPQTQPAAGATDELNGPDTLALISTPAPPPETSDPTVQPALLSESEATKAQRAVNDQ